MHIAPMMNYFQMNQSSSFSKMQQKKKVMPGNSGILRSGAKKKTFKLIRQRMHLNCHPCPCHLHTEKMLYLTNCRVCYSCLYSVGVSLCIQLQERSYGHDFRAERGVTMPSLIFLQQCDLWPLHRFALLTSSLMSCVGFCILLSYVLPSQLSDQIIPRLSCSSTSTCCDNFLTSALPSGKNILFLI